MDTQWGKTTNSYPTLQYHKIVKNSLFLTVELGILSQGKGPLSQHLKIPIRKVVLERELFKVDQKNENFLSTN